MSGWAGAGIMHGRMDIGLFHNGDTDIQRDTGEIPVAVMYGFRVPGSAAGINLASLSPTLQSVPLKKLPFNIRCKFHSPGNPALPGFLMLIQLIELILRP